MELYIDTANIEDIREIAAWGVLSGATTNPTLLSRESGDYDEIIREICDLVGGPVSAEVMSEDAEGMVMEAERLAGLDENVVIKLPMSPEGLSGARELNGQGVKTNVTLVFSANQALLAARAGATFVSPFVGRLDDIGHDSSQVLSDIVEVFAVNEFSTKVIAASIRHPLHVTEAALLGCDIATIPPDVYRKMVKHPLTDRGIASFKNDWEKAQARNREAAERLG
ncbi:MAG: fructose-6-phosphate aldolase [Thermoleophilia bacterium]|nr:fructose-6-phosphate aldolase [Thermoleophilia bacterium]